VVNQLPRYQRRVDGVVLPVDVAGEPSLDFCNTRAGWNSTEPREYLVSYDHLVLWAREASLVDPATAERLRQRAARDPERSLRVLACAVALRDSLYAACTDPGAEAAWNEVAKSARAGVSAAVLRPERPPGERWRVPESAGLELPLLELGRAAGDFLAAADVSTVRACPGHDCGWLFLDPRGRRRWCTMAVCGNRAKARRHAARTKRG
jgi:predicted RNA-binding Zn ribbon-like protein